MTEATIRKRIQQGSPNKELGSDGRVYVYLDLTQDMSRPESRVHRDPLVEGLVEELKDRGAFLEEVPDRVKARPAAGGAQQGAERAQ